jgi:hypothetical protein
VLVFFLARSYRAAFRAQDDLGYLVAAGIATQLACYTFVNLGVATGPLPDDRAAAAVRQLRRLGAGHEPRGRGHPRQHVGAGDRARRALDRRAEPQRKPAGR